MFEDRFSKKDKFEAFKLRWISPTDLLEWLDNSLVDDMLSEEDNNFMKGYYLETKHVNDLFMVIGHGFYETVDSIKGFEMFV